MRRVWDAKIHQGLALRAIFRILVEPRECSIGGGRGLGVWNLGGEFGISICEKVLVNKLGQKDFPANRGHAQNSYNDISPRAVHTSVRNVTFLPNAGQFNAWHRRTGQITHCLHNWRIKSPRVYLVVWLLAAWSATLFLLPALHTVTTVFVRSSRCFTDGVL